MPFRRSIAMVLSLSAAACVAPRTPPPAPEPVATTPARPAPTPTPAAVYDSWMDVPQTPGDWRYGPAAGGTAASFGGAAQPVFTMRCVPASRTIELIRSGTFAGDAPMTVRTETATRTLAASPVTGSADLRAALSARDPLLDAMAFSKGRFAIDAAGSPTLYLPSWPEVTRVIEDCR